MLEVLEILDICKSSVFVVKYSVLNGGNMDFYAHTITKYYDYDFKDIDKLKKILKSGYLLSRNKLGLDEDSAAFNGMDYISLCDLGVRHDDYSAYSMYTKKGLSLLFDKKINVIKPIVIDRNGESILTYFDKMHEMGMGKIRYSDFHDEVQVKDKLSLSYLSGVSLSLDRIICINDFMHAKEYLKKIREMLIEYEYDIPIYNIDNEEQIKIKSLRT